jgi:ParB family chromosome partitioning protein
MTARATLPLGNIRVGKRHRRNLGDIESLAASIADIGLLHPITVDEDGRLLAGARRLAACKQLDWKEIPVNVVKAQT